MLWDFLKFEIRTTSIEYSINISQKRNREECQPIENINYLKSRISINPTDEFSDEIKQCKTDLEKLFKVKTNGCIDPVLITLNLVRETPNTS